MLHTQMCNCSAQAYSKLRHGTSQATVREASIPTLQPSTTASAAAQQRADQRRRFEICCCYRSSACTSCLMTSTSCIAISLAPAILALRRERCGRLSSWSASTCMQRRVARVILVVLVVV